MSTLRTTGPGGGSGKEPAAGPPTAAARPGAVTRLVTAGPRRILVAALVFVVVCLFLGSGVGERLRNGGTTDPGADSADAARLLDQEFPGSRPNLVILVEAEKGVDNPAVSRQATEIADRLEAEPEVARVVSYWEAPLPTLRSEDGTAALITAQIRGEETDAQRFLERAGDDYRGVHGDLVLRVGGEAALFYDLQQTINADLVRAEVIALPITLLILVVVFRGLVAALLPVCVGVIAIIGTNAVLWVVSQFTDVSVFAQNLTTALGLGLAIDYALLFVRRYRERLHEGATPADAVAVAMSTSGRAIAFSAVVVMVSLSAMLVFPMYFLRSFAYAGMSVVALAAAAALLVLPALLLVLGRRVDALPVAGLLPRGLRERFTAERGGQGWERVARAVMRRPLAVTVVVGGLLVVAGLPLLRIQLGEADDRQLPEGTESRIVSETVREEFPADPTRVVEVAVPDVVAREVPTGLSEYARRLSELPGVDRVDGPAGVFEDGQQTGQVSAGAEGFSSENASYLAVTLEHPSASVESQRVVEQIRAAEAPWPVHVGGSAAEIRDTSSAILDRLPWAAAAVVGITLVLIFLLTGSLVLPVAAVVLNTLSLGAMYGVAVWVFQDGNGSGLLGFTPTGFLDASLPVLMFCVAFGLSMDYGIFVIARIAEERRAGLAHGDAVAAGLRHTGGVVTAAAAILATVLIAIGSSRIANTQLLGNGVALAVLMDAMVVRCLLVPAVLQLLGERTWWAPGRLVRWRDRFAVFDEAAVPPVAAPPPGAAPPAAERPAEPEPAPTGRPPHPAA